MTLHISYKRERSRVPIRSSRVSSLLTFVPSTRVRASLPRSSKFVVITVASLRLYRLLMM